MSAARAQCTHCVRSCLLMLQQVVKRTLYLQALVQYDKDREAQEVASTAAKMQ